MRHIPVVFIETTGGKIRVKGTKTRGRNAARRKQDGTDFVDTLKNVLMNRRMNGI